MQKYLFYCLILFLGMAGTLPAQSRESADRNPRLLQGGVEFSAFNADVYCPSNLPFHCGDGAPLIKGIGVFSDYSVRGRFGAEAEARWLHWDGKDGQIEATYLIGPRYRFYRWGRFDLWAKGLVGVGNITTGGYPAPQTLKGTLLVYALGGAVDYKLNGKLSARLDYEWQRWPAFALAPPHDHGISPSGLSLGLAYTILR